MAVVALLPVLFRKGDVFLLGTMGLFVSYCAQMLMTQNECFLSNFVTI